MQLEDVLDTEQFTLLGLVSLNTLEVAEMTSVA